MSAPAPCLRISPRSLADQYIVMERGEILKQGAGADMDKDGVKQLLAV